MLLSHALRSCIIIVLGIIAEICIIWYDVHTRGALTGFSVAGIAVVLALAAVAFVNQHRLDRLVHLARWNRHQGGRVPLIIPISFAVGIITGHICAGSGEPSSFWLMLVSLLLLGAFVAHSRRPRRNRKTRSGIIKRWLAWRQVRKAARSVRLVEVLR
jgi:MYXO-CTERM domain-containing protein